jgi:hypothetical protein
MVQSSNMDFWRTQKSYIGLSCALSDITFLRLSKIHIGLQTIYYLYDNGPEEIHAILKWTGDSHSVARNPIHLKSLYKTAPIFLHRHYTVMSVYFGPVSPDFLPQGWKFRASCEEMADCHWLAVAGAHVAALNDSKLMVQMMLLSAVAWAEAEYHLLSPGEAV